MTPSAVSQPPSPVAKPFRWGRTAIVVALVHLVLLLGVDLVVPIGGQEDSVDDQAMAVQMVSLPPPAFGARAVAPAVEPAPSAPAPAPAEPPALSPESAPPAPAQTEDFSSRTPSLEELPRVGGVALSAYWGDHTSGAPIGKGSIEVNFSQDGRYRIRLMTEAVGWARIFATKPLFAETVGSIGPGGLRPERYTHRSPRGKEEVSVFDYDTQKISYSSLKDPLPLLNGIQDRLSFMIQLAWMMKVNPEKFSLGEIVHLPMAGRNKVEKVDFVVLSDQDVVLPGGVLVPAVHLSTFRKAERFSGQIDVWLDKTDRLLPVRIRFEESRGQVLDLITLRE